MRSFPLLYEINTRVWLRELSESHGRPVTLGSIPEEQFARWERLGFTHIWLMGVWTSGAIARAKALEHQAEYRASLPNLTAADVGPSPYAIAAYSVPEMLGGVSGLKAFRWVLNAHGLRLVLDFVPNHLGLDHAWIRERPHLFVEGGSTKYESLQVLTDGGAKWLAHGKDPYFPAWNDTVQLDYRKAETRAAMIQQLLQVGTECDGVRCDMAMLLLNDVFDSTWRLTGDGLHTDQPEFWSEAISRVREVHPDFLFIAEAYWGLEERLCELGFDFAYDKCVCDHIVRREHGALRRHLIKKGPSGLARGVHFLENHDELRIAAQLAGDELRAAMALMLALPGLRLLHEGQIDGRRVRTPVQLLRRQPEKETESIRVMYEQLLNWLRGSIVDRAKFELLALPDMPAGLFPLLWTQNGSNAELVAINLTPESTSVSLQQLERTRGYTWVEIELGSPENRQETSLGTPISLQVPGFGVRILRAVG